ncbi:MAG: dihydroneopterin aldolase [Urechidicola sp.]|nr:dihydroneopterin aldolase [Urechidicola sp.]
MGVIKVKNIKLFAYHGCLEEEAKIGSDYRVDLKVKANLNKSSQSDELVDTVDYVHLNKIVKEEMAIRSKLLEHVVDRIINRVLLELQMVFFVSVSVSKINPPIGGNVEMVTVVRMKKRKV